MRIFVGAGAFAHKHEARGGRAVAEDDFVAALVERAAGAVADIFADELEEFAAVFDGNGIGGLGCRAGNWFAGGDGTFLLKRWRVAGLRRVVVFDPYRCGGRSGCRTEGCVRWRLIDGSRRRARFRFIDRKLSEDCRVDGAAVELSEAEVAEISGGLMRERVDVTINKLALGYDLLLIIGPTFPHEVVGFSGGNKYLFPGIGGPELLNMFHWLGALITNPSIIGTKYTPVRAVVDRAAALVPVERKCASLVVEGTALAGLYLGAPEETWAAAAELSSQIHVIYKDHAFKSVLSCAPPMYDELWVGGKCAYKLEPVVADGGEIVIYAPHIHEISVVHGALIRRIGYHVRDYFLKQPGRFPDVPRGVLAHSTHVKGIGRYEDGVETPRITVTLATGIGPEECRAVNLGYRDHRSIDLATDRKSVV